MAGKFLLCFHDFSVWNYQKVVPVLEELRDLAGRPFNVLVIPDTEKASPEAIDGFRAALLKLKAEGMSLNVPVVMEIKADGLKGDAPVGTVKMTTKSVFGKSEQSFCFDKDYVYLSREDARYRISREDEAASEFSSASRFTASYM